MTSYLFDIHTPFVRFKDYWFYVTEIKFISVTESGWRINEIRAHNFDNGEMGFYEFIKPNGKPLTHYGDKVFWEAQAPDIIKVLKKIDVDPDTYDFISKSLDNAGRRVIQKMVDIEDGNANHNFDLLDILTTDEGAVCVYISDNNHENVKEESYVDSDI